MCVEPKWRKRGEYPRPHNVPQHDGDIVYTEYFECAKRKTLKCEAKLKIFHKKNRNPEKKIIQPHTCNNGTSSTQTASSSSSSDSDDNLSPSFSSPQTVCVCVCVKHMCEYVICGL